MRKTSDGYGYYMVSNKHTLMILAA